VPAILNECKACFQWLSHVTGAAPMLPEGNIRRWMWKWDNRRRHNRFPKLAVQIGSFLRYSESIPTNAWPLKPTREVADTAQDDRAACACLLRPTRAHRSQPPTMRRFTIRFRRAPISGFHGITTLPRLPRILRFEMVSVRLLWDAIPQMAGAENRGSAPADT
jgi:hypothetical protein